MEQEQQPIEVRFLHLKSCAAKICVLRNLSGIIRPRRLTLLLGPPASGKSTLLQCLAGRIKTSSGTVEFNGLDLAKFVVQKTSTYVGEEDLHTAMMTVRETIEFSALFLGASIPTDTMLKVLGLEQCSEVIVGDNMYRGILGGQKKRLSIGELLVGSAKVLFMDGISTGLDSATTFQIVSYLKELAHTKNYTITMSLLQPAREVFELFDDIILLSDGEIVYQGPCEHVLRFFQDMGFECPERKGVADFLQEVTSLKGQAQYWADSSRDHCYISPGSFSEAFKESGLGQQLSQDLSVPFYRTSNHVTALARNKYALNNWGLFTACFQRELLLMKRNRFIYMVKTFQFTVTAVIAMTVFLRKRMNHHTLPGANTYMGALFFGIIAVMFNGLSELIITIERLPVFYKQRDLMLFPGWAYALSCIILRVPFSILEPAIWTSLTYWVIGFAPETSRFFCHFLILVLAHLMSSALFRALAAVGQTKIMGHTFGAFSLLIMFVMGGYVLSRDNIPSWWSWAYWMSPMMYVQTAISINEFKAVRWKSTGIGDIILGARGLFSESYWLWIGLLAVYGFILLFNVLFILALTYFTAPSRSRATAKKVGITNPLGGEAELEDGMSGKGMILPFRQLSLTFEHVNYYIGSKENRQVQLLRDVSGSFRAGVLTALVGVSGAGKTTLMDVLAGRKTAGYIEGDVKISGYPAKQASFARVLGYCEQTDIHSPNVTVYESVVFSAYLRLKPADKQTRMMFVKEVIDLVELQPLCHALVNHLSVEQRKRLTIAVELVANPSIIFMDEPTTGLDARSAAIVMQVVRNTVNTGRTVVCTIHQPGIDIFESFDEMLLLKMGGEVIYAGTLGDRSQCMISYFEAVEGVPKIQQGCNPATWMLEVTSSSMEEQLGVSFADIYKQSSLSQTNEMLVREASVPKSDTTELDFSKDYTRSFASQCIACLWKQHWSYWRNPVYWKIRIGYTLICALLFGSMFWGIRSKMSTQQDLLNVLGFFYVGILGIGLNNASIVQPVVEAERAVYYREKAAGLYSPYAYVIAQVLIEVPHVFVQVLLYVLVTYPMVGLHYSAFGWSLFFFYMSTLVFTFYGMMAVAVTPNPQLASILCAAFYLLWNLFSGVVIPRKEIPAWWRWYYWANPLSWPLYGLLTAQFGRDDAQLLVYESGTETARGFLKNYFGFEYGFLSYAAVVQGCIAAILALIFALGVKFLNFQVR